MFKRMVVFFLKLMILIVAVFINASCNIKNNKTLVLPVNSSQLECCHENKLDSNSLELFLSKKDKNQMKMFNQQEAEIPVKGKGFGSQYVKSEVSYYELGQFNCNHNICKLIVYNKLGEADTLLFNVQLNIYDTKNNLLDALLLSSYFYYEDIFHFSHFSIYNDYSINIDNYVKYIYINNANGISDNLIEKPISQIYLEEKYKIDNDRFILISRVEKNR